jgi:uncharacterized protein
MADAIERCEGTEQGPGASDSVFEKERRLFARLRGLGSVLVAFSGGTDSAYLAWAAHEVLAGRALAVTALSPSFSEHDRDHAERFARETNLRHEFIETHEFENPLYVANNADRCFHCKTELFNHLVKIRAARGFAAMAYGMNADDAHDFRPGHRAATEKGVLAPLLDANLTKAEIRELSRRAGLFTWDRPASPCLSSRIPYGIPVTIEVLSQVERAESVLREFGFRQFRVRHHGETARIEIGVDELPRAAEPELLEVLVERIRKTGFTAVHFDAQGYRQGSLNAGLSVR